jgi:hypothetical protein
MKNKKNELIYQREVRITYLVIHTLILLTLIGSIIGLFFEGEKSQRIEHIILATGGLVLLNAPSFISKKWDLYIPSNMQILAIVFIYAHFILGEIYRVYDYSLVFDKVLHTTSGLAFSALGFSLVNLLNESKNTHLSLSPFFVSLFSFCFSMMVAGMWEVFEYLVDEFTGSNMQRWQIIGEILNIKDPGRVGLVDTMGDIIVCFFGSVLVSVAGYISLKSKKNWLNKLMIRRFNDLEYAKEEAISSNDPYYIELINKIEKNKSKITK